MAKLEDILKARGYSDADMASIQALLADSRFRSTLEESFSGVESERDAAKLLNDQWQEKLDTVFNPAIGRAEQEAAAARMEAARLREQVQIAKDYGYNPPDDKIPTPPVTDPKAPPPFDPKAHKLVTYDDVQVFARNEGDAIALMHDISDEYASLYAGKRLSEYVGPNGKRGIRALLEEARAARQTIDTYVETKFNFSGKRQEAATAAQKSHDEQVGRESVSKYIQEHGGNPNLTIAMPSNQPYIPAKPKEGGQPWQRGTEDQLRAARIERASKVAAQEQLVH